MMGIVTDVESEAGTVLHFPTADEPDPAGWSIFKDKYEVSYFTKSAQDRDVC